MNVEKRLSQYIDSLNHEKKPWEHNKKSKDSEYTELMETVRRVRSLREPAMPSEEYSKQLIASLRGKNIEKNTMKEMQTGSNNNFNLRYPLAENKKHKLHRYMRRSLIAVAAAAVAAVIYLAAPEGMAPWNKVSIVQAMEQALQELKAYHGIIEVIEMNELGETMTQAKREVWANRNGNYRIVELEGYSEGLVTVNNGSIRWQLRQDELKAYLFPAFPDPYRFTFELGNEVEDVRNALSVREVGEEKIAGRNTIILEVTPKGGETYRLWIDQETDLPLQRETAMQNAIQIKVSYTEIDFSDAIPEGLLKYQLPGGFTEVETDPEQIVTSLEEAENMAGFLPTLLKVIPEGYALEQLAVRSMDNSVKLLYKSAEDNHSVVILQKETEMDLKPDSGAILGIVNGNTAELLNNYQGQTGTNSIRWKEGYREFLIFGNVSRDKLTIFAEGLVGGKVLTPASEVDRQPSIEVPVDMTVEENEQKSVDAGHSPWRLDPAFVAQVFANIMISPEGIVGEYKIPYEDIEITVNTGTEAIAKINNKDSLAEYIYMKRLVRQDDTGIWTVVGYDPIKR